MRSPHTCFAVHLHFSRDVANTHLRTRLHGGGRAQVRKKPLMVAALERARICQLSAGSTHSLAVSVSGELYGWGCAASGRLGVGEEYDAVHALLPVLVELPK